MKLIFLLAIPSLIIPHCPLRAADLTAIDPLTDRILLLRIEDGAIIYSEDPEKELIRNDPWDVLKGSEPGRYSISSPDDGRFSSGIRPIAVGRKSKPSHVSGKCRWNGSQCANTVVMTHEIYLLLPHPMERGRTYKVGTSGLAGTVLMSNFIFDDFRSRSEAIHINHIGYRPSARGKFAYISHWMGSLGPLGLDDYAGQPFHLVDAVFRKPVFSGTIRLRKALKDGEPEMGSYVGPHSNLIGADLWECDFSEFRVPGEYAVVAEGIGSSFPFRIDGDVYRKAFTTSARGLYHQRSGIALEKPFADWTRPRPHHPDDGWKVWYSKYRFMDATSEGAEKEVKAMKTKIVKNIWGWYQDAGDWDTYPSHFVIPRLLLTVYELKPGNFSDSELNLPESGNGTPDIIDEASWQVRYLRRAKGPSGGIAGSRVEQYGKQADGSDTHSVPSWKDTSEWIAFGEEPKASFGYASLACQLAFCLDIAAGERLPDSTDWIRDAEKVYRWAARNMRPGDGEKVASARMLADAWLFKTTGKRAYHSRFQAAVEKMPAFDPDAACNNDFMWAVWCYVTTARPETNPALKERLTALALKWADDMNVNPAARRGVRAGIHFYVPTLIGFNSTPHVMPSIIAHELTQDPKYLDVIETTCDYMLGGNAMNLCQVSGLGHRSPDVFLKVDARFSGQAYPPGVTIYSVFLPQDPLNWTGPWDSNMFWDRVYPRWKEWPVHEGYADNPWNVMGNEYTVHQNIAPSAAAYGYLCGKKGP